MEGALRWGPLSVTHSSHVVEVTFVTPACLPTPEALRAPGCLPLFLPPGAQRPPASPAPPGEAIVGSRVAVHKDIEARSRWLACPSHCPMSQEQVDRPRPSGIPDGWGSENPLPLFTQRGLSQGGFATLVLLSQGVVIRDVCL